jgi:hypothetical protein
MFCAGPLIRAEADLRLGVDVQVTAQTDGAQSQSSASSPDDTRHVKIYYSGDKARVEDQNGLVTLFDLNASRVYRLRPADKQYSMVSLHDFLIQNEEASLRSVPAGRAGRELKTDVKLDLKKDTVVEPRQYAGKQAIVYDLTESQTARPDVSEEPRRGSQNGGYGGRRGRRGGGFPGGGFPLAQAYGVEQRGPGGVRSDAIVSLQRFEGEVWVTESVSLKSRAKRPLVPFLLTTMMPEQALNALADKIAKLKAFPLSLKITSSQRDPRSDTAVGIATTVRCEVKEISEESLDDSLFKIPADYAKDPAH